MSAEEFKVIGRGPSALCLAIICTEQDLSRLFVCLFSLCLILMSRRLVIFWHRKSSLYRQMKKWEVCSRSGSV